MPKCVRTSGVHPNLLGLAAPARESGNVELKDRGLRKKKVLLVDDDSEFREIAAYRLAADDFEVTHADNGAQAVDKLVGETFDAVIVDLLMPEMDGIAFIEHLKVRHPKLARRVIIVTARRSQYTERLSGSFVCAVLEKQALVVERLVRVTTTCIETAEAAGDQKY